ncbi:ParB/RepB/Spo0J family partition protein [Succinivibrio dextrinosolvens DSM 3072]|uniref:Probable chromosome-partitioning protein ParB n=1 Tax=Succinivibrio dextrinosolvens DSM 3072 TaxID=1123324 RepID=A0A1T4V321_9GAMM|nr:ParB/RepB/Spo0J family partition protein [Succinivibrio dextrinosolvens]SKA59267.1 ParB/RepB/Spo0J family partition protein [Succinivibrio dextrinosolvens DSM 3072]
MAGLGRGLGSLLGESQKIKKERQKIEVAEEKAQESSPAESAEAVSNNSVVNISIDKLKASIYQPRKIFDEDSLNELADSIKEHGLLEPLIVKKSEDIYEIICGERRFRACQLASLTEIPCLVRDDLDSNGYALALIENIQREDLNPLEMAEAFKQMLEECQISQEELAKTLGKSRSTVTNIIRLNNLQEDVKKMVVANQIDLGHAKVLLSIEDLDLQLKAALYVIKKSLNVRQTEELVKNIKVNGFDETKNKKVVFTSEKFGEWEKIIRQNLSGIKAKFKATSDSKGKLTLAYSSVEQLESLLNKLSIDADVKDLNVTPTLEDNVEEDISAEESAAEDISSNDIPSEEITSEEIVSEEVPAEEALSEDVAGDESAVEEPVSEEVVADETAPKESVSEEIAPEEATAEEAVSEDVATEDVAAEEAVPEDAAVDDIAAEDAVSEEIAADEVAPEEAVSEEIAADEVNPEEVVSEEIAADEVNPEEVVSEEIAADEVNPEEVVSEEIAADEVNPEEVVSEEVAPEEVISEDVSVEELAASEPAPEEGTEEVISEDVNIEDLMAEQSEEK